jgi:hypothetical protein
VKAIVENQGCHFGAALVARFQSTMHAAELCSSFGWIPMKLIPQQTVSRRDPMLDEPQRSRNTAVGGEKLFSLEFFGLTKGRIGTVEFSSVKYINECK